MLQDSLMAFSLVGSEWVLWLLVGLSVLSISVALERVLSAVLNHTPGGPLRAALAAFAESSDHRSLAAALGSLRGAEARFLGAAAQVAARGPDSVEEAMLAAMTQERARMERGLVILGTVGANAPFIGLFGTVWGILRAFQRIGVSGQASIQVVGPDIANALIATAVGLVAAIPAVMAYNYFNTRLRVLSNEMENFSNDFLNIVKRHFRAL